MGQNRRIMRETQPEPAANKTRSDCIQKGLLVVGCTQVLIQMRGRPVPAVEGVKIEGWGVKYGASLCGAPTGTSASFSKQLEGESPREDSHPCC